MGDSKKDVKKLKEDMKKLLADEKLDDAKMAEMQARLDTMSPDPYKDVNANYEEWKKNNQFPQPPSPHECQPHAHFDERQMRCICDQFYIPDVNGLCVPQMQPPSGTDNDKYGVRKIYKDKPNGFYVTGEQFEADNFWRNYASGGGEWSYENEHKSKLTTVQDLECTFAVKINDFKKEEDTISIKLLGDDHSDGSKDKWLIFQVSTLGKPGKNFQIEDPHPKNHDNHQKTLFDIGESIIGKWIIIKACTFKTPDGADRYAATYINFPVADIDHVDNNNWRKYIEIQSVKGLTNGFVDATGNNALLRIDGVTKDGKMPDVMYQSIREIIPEFSGQIPTVPEPPVTPPVTPPTTPPTTPPAGAGTLLYDSNQIGGWANGQARTVDKSDGNISPNGCGLEMHASGSPTLIIDGQGTAVLSCQPGHGRAYIFAKNYNGILEEEIMFDANVENHTIQTRSRHQEGGDGPNRFGGLSAKVSPVDVGLKIERFHNEHLADQEKKLAKPLEIGKWYKIRYTYNDAAGGGIYQKLDIDYGQGFQEVLAQTTTAGIEPYFTDKASFEKNSYFWLRMNNTKAAKLGIRNVKLYAQ